MKLRFVHVDGDGLQQYGDQLRALEADIRYPIADGRDHFRIDHGARYARFFEDIGEAHFWLALAGERVVGIGAAALKHLDLGGARVPTMYAADYKIAPDFRGGRVSRWFLWRAFVEAFTPRSSVPRWRLAFGAAMRGARGDVMRAARRRVSPMHLARPSARLAVYFVPKAELARVGTRDCPPAPTGGVDLSPRARVRPDGTVTTEGTKDLRLDSLGGARWPLVHLPLGPSHWRPHLGAYLASSSAALGDGDIACFALDERLPDHIAWLRARGVEPGAACTVYSFVWPGVPRLGPWLHLATSEI